MKSHRMMLQLMSAMACLAFALAPAFAESGSRTGDASDLLLGSQCPPDNGPCFDPNASGTKLTGKLTVVYDKTTSDVCTIGTPFVRNMYVNITLDQGNVLAPFTTDYLNGPPSHSTGFCMLSNTPEQVKVMVELIRTHVIPFFFNCDPASPGSCPGFRVKSVTNFQYTTGDPRLIPNQNNGGFSADITIATK